MTAAPSEDTVVKLTQALAIQKKKFLIAINKHDPADAAAGSFSLADEQLVEEVTIAEIKLLFPSGKRPSSKMWTDSEATLCIKDTLQRHAVFQLTKYLDCAEVLCKIFSQKPKQSALTKTVNTIMEYVLTHARQFGDPAKNVFQIEAATNEVTKFYLNNILLELSSQSSCRAKVRRAEQLISELRGEYDETKFQALNARITSFVFIILRRLMKGWAVSSYSICRRLSICLVIDAYLNCDDEKTKKNIRYTCIKYIEWHRMQLPGLFFKVVDLYGIQAGELWDLLTSFKGTAYSLITLATEYYAKYQLSKVDSSQNQHWFAFCRMFDTPYHRNLSNSANAGLCAILNNLIEKKTFNDVEPAYKFTCPDNADKVNEWAAKIGTEVFTKINE